MKTTIYIAIVYALIGMPLNKTFNKEIHKDRSHIVAESNNEFTRYEFNKFSLSVPNTLELRNEGSYISTVGKHVREEIKKVKKIDIDEFKFAFQPKGADDRSDVAKQKKALGLYARVLLSYEKGNKNDYLSWNDANIGLSSSEYQELNLILKEGLYEEIARANQAGLNMRLLTVKNIKIEKNANKFVYIVQEYERSGLKGNVKVIDYYIHNNDEIVKLTLSYRISEENLWRNDFNKIIDSFNFNIRK